VETPPTHLINLATVQSVSSDGQHFLMVDPLGDPRADALTLIVGWNETLKR